MRMVGEWKPSDKVLMEALESISSIDGVVIARRRLSVDKPWA